MRIRCNMIWNLAVMAILCGVGGGAMGQTNGETTQYPQYVQYPQGAPPVTPAGPGKQIILTAGQIDQLLGPIALYPDPLLSLIFPAATYPQDVVAAEQWLASTPSPTEADITAQSWDGSIKGLAHYPTVLKMMNDQIEWTQTVGAAFLTQQQDVLSSVQRLRAQAQAAGSLVSGQQEQVVADDGDIRIEPVDPDVMYVPQYDPNSIYSSDSPVSYGIGWPMGLWDDNDFDWNSDYIVVGGGWYRGWHHPAAWDRRPSGWAASPQRWTRASARPAPRLMSSAVSHLNLNRPRGALAVSSAPGAARQMPARQPVERQPSARPYVEAFSPTQNRDEVQRSEQRARPAPAQPAADVQRPVVNQQRELSPGQSEERPAPRPQAPVQQRPAQNNAFSGGSGGQARAQSARGHASGHR